MDYKVSILQMDITDGNPQKNRAKAVFLINQAAREKPDVILLPEMWTTGFYFEDLDCSCDNSGEPTLELLRDLAKLHNINIVAGTIADRVAGSIYNRAYIIDRSGKVISSYDKIHLFSMAEEGKHIAAGDQLCVFYLDGIKCGIITCYDLRFPELARSLALEGIKLMFVPAQWPASRLKHWETLLMARAIENQVFLAAANRGAGEAIGEYAGGSMLLDPWGETITKARPCEEIIYGTINLGVIEEIKKKIDIFKDRVPKLYKTL